MKEIKNEEQYDMASRGKKSALSDLNGKKVISVLLDQKHRMLSLEFNDGSKLVIAATGSYPVGDIRIDATEVSLLKDNKELVHLHYTFDDDAFPDN